MLRTVIQYCENKADCRRAQVLGYFSEAFDASKCNSTCDNCRSDATFVTKDLTDYAAMAIKLVSQVHEDNVTMHQCVDAFRGAGSAKIKRSGLEEYGWGYGKDLERGDNERIFQHLLDAGAFRERSKVNKVGFATNYLHVCIYCPDCILHTDDCSLLRHATTTRANESSSSFKFVLRHRKRARKHPLSRRQRKPKLRFRLPMFPPPYAHRSRRSDRLPIMKRTTTMTMHSKLHDTPPAVRPLAGTRRTISWLMTILRQYVSPSHQEARKQRVSELQLLQINAPKDSANSSPMFCETS